MTPLKLVMKNDNYDFALTYQDISIFIMDESDIFSGFQVNSFRSWRIMYCDRELYYKAFLK